LRIGCVAPQQATGLEPRAAQNVKTASAFERGGGRGTTRFPEVANFEADLD
jgi:hypothetical protein